MGLKKIELEETKNFVVGIVKIIIEEKHQKKELIIESIIELFIIRRTINHVKAWVLKVN